jgi:hypothetical protein
MVVRVATLGRPAFELRKGEEGLSISDFKQALKELESHGAETPKRPWLR